MEGSTWAWHSSALTRLLAPHEGCYVVLIWDTGLCTLMNVLPRLNPGRFFCSETNIAWHYRVSWDEINPGIEDGGSVETRPETTPMKALVWDWVYVT